ncbi:MAG: ABC transporter ATP-binding protein, partial [Clostridia bacterium]|nr:ABC transporter ATP-binding protein [Clostridia bacterium]
MIEVKSLVKKYPGKLAVDNVSFSIGCREIVGLLGANGAGKSTIMNMITGYTAMTSGTITVGGLDILEEPMAARKKIGYLPEQPPLYGDMTVEEYLNFVFALKKSETNPIEDIRQACMVMDITDVKGRLIKHLSKGYRQRVGFAQALIGNPDILILDEPTVGLDPKQ